MKKKKKLLGGRIHKQSKDAESVLFLGRVPLYLLPSSLPVSSQRPKHLRTSCFLSGAVSNPSRSENCGFVQLCTERVSPPPPGADPVFRLSWVHCPLPRSEPTPVLPSIRQGGVFRTSALRRRRASLHFQASQSGK